MLELLETLEWRLPLSQQSSDVNHIFLLTVNQSHRTEVSRLHEQWWIVHSAIWPCKRLIYNLWQAERILGGWGLVWLVSRVIFLAGWFVILDCNNNVTLSLKSNNQYIHSKIFHLCMFEMLLLIHGKQNIHMATTDMLKRNKCYSTLERSFNNSFKNMLTGSDIVPCIIV